MLGWLLIGVILTAAVISITVIYLDKDTAKRELQKNNVRKGVVKEVIESGSVTHIKLDAIKEDGREVEVDFEAPDYNSFQIRKGVMI